MEAARQAGEDKLRDDNGKVPPLSDLKTPLHYNKEDNTYYINAYSTRRPEVVDRNKEKLDPAEVHPGAFVRVVLDFYAYRHGDKCGITCTLALVQKIKDGERPVYGSALDDLPDLDGDGSDDDDDDDGILP